MNENWRETIPPDQLRRLEDAAGGNQDLLNAAGTFIQYGVEAAQVVGLVEKATPHTRSGTSFAGGTTR